RTSPYWSATIAGGHDPGGAGALLEVDTAHHRPGLRSTSGRPHGELDGVKRARTPSPLDCPVGLSYPIRPSRTIHFAVEERSWNDSHASLLSSCFHAVSPRGPRSPWYRLTRPRLTHPGTLRRLLCCWRGWAEAGSSRARPPTA